MAESVDLQVFSFNNIKESDSKELAESEHVSSDNTNIISSSSFRVPKNHISDHDFFTQQNNIHRILKRNTKKRKKSRVNSQNLMHMINIELATTPLLQENIFVAVDKFEKQPHFVQEFCATACTNSIRRYDVEKRRALKTEIRISPKLSNSSNKDTNLSLSFYTGASLFSDLAMNLDEQLIQSPTFLSIHIKNLKILYHQDYTLENLLGVKLELIFKDYQRNQKAIHNVIKEIAINRNTRKNLREHLLKISPNKKDEIRFDKTVLKYTKIMLHLKEKYYVMLNVNKKAISQMVSLWADIETIRIKTGAINTPYTFQVRKEQLDDTGLKKECLLVFEEEYSDMLIKLEYEYILKYLEYKELKQNVEEKKGVLRPKLQINNRDLKTKVDVIVSSIIYNNSIDISLLKNEKLFSKKPHNHISKHIYTVKVYVDDVFVCQSDEWYDKNKFNDINLTELFSIEILPLNKKIKISLYEDSDKISSLHFQLHNIKEAIPEATYSVQTFISDKIIRPSLMQVGSGYTIKDIAAAQGTKLKSTNLFKGKLFSTYETSMKIGWKEKTDTSHESIKSFINLKNSLKRLLLGVITPTVEFLAEVLINLYGKNIVDDVIWDTLRQVCSYKLKTNNKFDLNDQDESRFKLLCLRNLCNMADRNNFPIPLLANQISTEQFGYLISYSESEYKFFEFEDDNAIDYLDVHRFIGVRYVKKLNKKLLDNIRDFLMERTFRDIVRDFEDLSFRSICTYHPKLNLNATSILTKQRNLLNNLNREQEIRVTVLSACNLLNRDTTENNEDYDDFAGIKMHPLRPYARITYHGVSHRTPTAIGCHPVWNHTLVVKSKLEPLSCIYINIYDERQINVKDSDLDQSYHYRKYASWLGCVQIPLRTVLDAGNLKGAFKVTTPPFIFGYEILNEIKTSLDVMQFLKKDTSLIVLNITTSLSHLAGHSYNQPAPSNIQDDLIIKHLNNNVSNYLNDFPTRNICLTLIDSSGKNRCITEFLQPIPVPDLECFPKTPKNLGSALSKNSVLSKSSSSKSSIRKSVERDDIQILPQGRDSVTMDENQVNISMETVIRYVSLIPAFEVLESNVVTLMGSELLKVMYGSPLDHTVLLASYFIYLGIKCYVVTGLSLPRGISSYVLVKCNNDRVVTVDEDVKKGFWTKNVTTVWSVYDAVSGERYDLREIGCPLKTATHVFDGENIWLNVQSSQDCENMSFDLSRTSDWQPVFNKPMFLTKPIENLYYPPRDVERLRYTLEEKIKSRIHKWRSHVKTTWNRYCSGLLKETLPHWEYWSLNKSRPKPTLGHRLQQLMLSYKISGFPMNMPYLNPRLITSKIKSTCVYATNDPNAEFGLAIELYSYPNNVISVWVFLVSIIKIDD